MGIKISEHNYPVGRGYSHIQIRKEGWTEGEVYTIFGTVCVYAQGDDGKHFSCTSLRFVWNGRVYVRNFSGKRYSPRGIVTKAKQFAAEVSMKGPYYEEE